MSGELSSELPPVKYHSCLFNLCAVRSKSKSKVRTIENNGTHHPRKRGSSSD